MGLLKARYQERWGNKIVDTHRNDELVMSMGADLTPAPHDLDAACALLNLGIPDSIVVNLLRHTPEPEIEEGEEWKGDYSWE